MPKFKSLGEVIPIKFDKMDVGFGYLISMIVGLYLIDGAMLIE